MWYREMAVLDVWQETVTSECCDAVMRVCCNCGMIVDCRYHSCVRCMITFAVMRVGDE